MVDIRTSCEKARGCGYRKKGGKYLISDGVSVPCGRLPIPLDRCPCCGAGIKFCRSWTWVDGDAIVGQKECSFHNSPNPGSLYEHCKNFPLGNVGSIGRVGLLWIGEKFYKRPEDWTSEANEMGVSRRIPAVPKGMKVGKTLVLVAHKKAIQIEGCVCEPCEACKNNTCNKDGNCDVCGRAVDNDAKCSKCGKHGVEYQAAIFHAFTPTRVEYVVRGNESPDELQALVEKGFELVNVVEIGDSYSQNINDSDDDEGNE